MKTKDLVIGIDSSTTATKAIAWDRHGNFVAEGRAAIPLLNPIANHFEQNAEDWWSSTCHALTALTEKIEPQHVAGVAIANQRETFVPLLKNGSPARPGMVWLDNRAIENVEKFCDIFGAEKIHQISGKPKDVTPVIYRLAWMKEHESEIYNQVDQFAEVHSFLVEKLTNVRKTSWGSSDPMGMFEIEKKIWSSEVLAMLELRQEQFPQSCPPGTLLGTVTLEASKNTGLPVDLPVFAGGGDGQAAGLGMNCLSSQRAYLNLGTAVVSGVYSKDYYYDLAWRTMSSLSADGYILETCLRSGTFILDWYFDQFFSESQDRGRVFQELESQASQLPIGSEGLVVLPYWEGAMTPHWDMKARGCIVGLSGSHSKYHIYRAILESIAMEQAICTQKIEAATKIEVQEYVLIGGGASSDLWCQIIADATGKTVLRSTTIEASSLGVAIIVAKACGWYATFQEAAENMTGEIVAISPHEKRHQKFLEWMKTYDEIYAATKHSFAKIYQYLKQSG